ncbi:MAG: hypothetical protein FWE85_04800 [Clostridiales bacterium]|nr:hypothetical protein [Clostridiales bacterium]
MAEVKQIGDYKYIDSRGNTFNRSIIKINKIMGGEVELISGDMFDDPKGTKEDTRRFRKLDKRMAALGIDDATEKDRPDDISVEVWEAYLRWIRE